MNNTALQITNIIFIRIPLSPGETLKIINRETQASIVYLDLESAENESCEFECLTTVSAGNSEYALLLYPRSFSERGAGAPIVVVRLTNDNGAIVIDDEEFQSIKQICADAIAENFF